MYLSKNMIAKIYELMLTSFHLPHPTSINTYAMSPINMPSEMLEEKVIKAMQRNAGTDLRMSEKSISCMPYIMFIPTHIKAGAVAAEGIARNRGAKNKDRKKHPAVTSDVNPLRPPASTPEALSTKVLTVDVPSIAPTVVPTASAIKACCIRGNLPFSSSMPARDATPISVPTVSNMSRKNSVNTHTTISPVNTLLKSNLKSIGSMLGGTSIAPLKCVTPNGIPMKVVMRMPRSKEPGTLRFTRIEHSRVPMIARRTCGEWRSPKDAIVEGLETIMPALLIPMKAMNKPIPGAMALRKDIGNASTIFSRNPVIDMRMKMMPSIRTAVSANCHV